MTIEPTTPQDLSDAVERIVHRAQERVGPGSIGAEQYWVPGQPQKYQTMTLDALAEYITEESLDLINYGVMMTERADDLRAACAEVDRRSALTGVEVAELRAGMVDAVIDALADDTGDQFYTSKMDDPMKVDLDWRRQRAEKIVNAIMERLT